jgi:hypothetical protein
MNYYCITKPGYSSDYEAVITNGFAYSNESSGYYDLIKKGYPGPVDPRTILAELYSINVPPILWSTWTCAFLITDKLLSDFKKIGFSGYEAIPVEIAKVATKGKGKLRGGKKEYAGEPEDLILNRKNYLKEVKDLPILWGVAITGEMPLEVKHENLQDHMQRFVFASGFSKDLFYPIYKNMRYRRLNLCSERFKSFIVENQIENIAINLCSENWLDTLVIEP